MGATAARLVLAVLAFCLVSAGGAGAADRTNIPLKNWGGFSINRDALYDDLERLVTAGFVGRTLLSTKPLSRVEAARMVARAIGKVRADTDGVYNSRRDLEAVLDRLMAELAPELEALGVALNGETAPARPFVTFLPADRAQVWAGFASRDLTLFNAQGRRFEDGINGGLTFESRMQVGDFLTLYVQPEAVGNQEYGALRLATGYMKLTLVNVELLVGRDSLWWGPGLHGSLILSSNARPLDQIRVGSAEPFMLPLIGEWVGPMKALAFIAQLEGNRDHPRSKLAGMRVTASPFPFLEVGASRAVMFDPTDSLKLPEYPEALVRPDAGDPGDAEKFRNNNLFAIDADLRLHDVSGRWGLPARDMRLYGEFGWDDTCCNSNFIPLRRALSYLAGVHLINVFGFEGLDSRLEYAQTSAGSYTHSFFSDGYATRGAVISHHAGTQGRSVTSRVTGRVSPDVMVGLEVQHATIGSTARRSEEPKERRIGAALDVSWGFADVYALFAQYRLARVDNRDFRPGDDGFDHLLRVELTRSFR